MILFLSVSAAPILAHESNLRLVSSDASDKVLMWTVEDAENGNVNAQFVAGFNYEQRGDYGQARKWYLEAAHRNHALAALRLASLYDKGRGVPQDFKKAFEWRMVSAELGYSQAEREVSFAYAHGDGVPQDIVRAYMWSKLATMQDESYQSDLNYLAKGMTSEQIDAGEKLASRWMPAAARATRTRLTYALVSIPFLLIFVGGFFPIITRMLERTPRAVHRDRAGRHLS
jgi:TPR repeat protein